MQRIPVTSSDVRSIGHDPVSLVLEVEFNTGAVYRYFNVPRHLHESLMQASSMGRFLNTFIKNSYRYQRFQ